MKQKLLKTWLTVMCLLVGVGTSWGETAEFSWAGASTDTKSADWSVTNNGVTITFSKGNNAQNTPSPNKEGSVRLYTSTTMTVTAPTGKNITKIEFTSTNDSYTAKNLNYGKVALSSNTWELSDPANSVTLTATANARFKTIVVTFGTTGGTTPEPTPYTVTFNAGSNGSCSATSLTEESAGAGVTLPSCTANTNYTFEGWSTSSTPTSADAGAADATYKPSSNCTLYAYYTYQAPSHNAKFYVNGQQYGETQSVAKGSAITFPAKKPTVDDVVFIGWAEAEISGTQANAPTLVSNKNMGDTDANFYAVFATASGNGASGSYTLDYNNESGLSSSTAWGSYGTAYEYTASDGSKWVVKGYKNKGIQLNTGKNASIKVPDCPGPISSVVVTGGNVTYYFSESDYTGSNGSSIANAQGTTATIDLSDKNVSTGYIYTSASSAVTKVVVNYGSGTSYSDYCTTVSAKATATLNIAEADKNVALGYNGTKDVTISVSEAEYDGTLTIASSDENVARVTYTGTTATIKYVGEGEAYISVTAPSTTNYYAINATQAIKVTTTDDRGVATVTIDPETISVDNGSSADYSVTTAYNGTISVASDKPGVATVSYSEGKVTVEGKSVGTATLTISGEGTEAYKPFSKDFTITVNKVVPVGIKNLRPQITGTSSSKSNYEVKLENAVVTYVNGSNAYIEDGEAGILIYKSGHGFTAGDVLNGVVTGQGYVYNGLKELTSITGYEKTTGGEIPCTEVTLATIAADMQAWESRRIIVKGLTITETMDVVTSRYGKVSQNGTEFNVYEKVSGCTGTKLDDANQFVASIVCYAQDYQGTNTLSLWEENDITLQERADAQVVFDLAEGTGTNESPIAYTIGEDNTFPTAVVKDSEGNEIEGATVTYSTGNDAYISVNAETGDVTLKKYAAPSANVHVTATFAGNAQYKNATADYYLTISKGTPVIIFAEANVEVALDGVAGQTATITKGEGVAIKYTSSDPAVASFANENNATLTLNAEGITTITAQTVTNDAWNQSAKVTYTLTVTAPTAGYAIVTLDACGNDVEGYTEPLKVVKGRTVTLPTATTIKTDYIFRGWTAVGEVAKTTSVPTLVETNYLANADVTLYPVFSKEESDGEDDYDVAWVAVESSEIQTLGYDVVIVSTGPERSRCIKTTAGNAYLVGADVTIVDGKITSTISADSKWCAYESGTGVAFSSSAGNYLNASTVTYSEDQWTITPNGDKTYSMKSKNSNTYLYLSGNTWATTSDASLSKMQFFMETLVPVGGSTTYYVSRTMNVLELDENNTEIAEIYYEYDKVVVKRTIKAETWNTICLPFAMDDDQIAHNFGDDAEVMALEGLTVSGTTYTMNFAKTTTMECGKPYMIRVSNPVSVIIVEGNVEVDTTEEPRDYADDEAQENVVSFYGNYAKTTVAPNDGNYVISNNKFYYVNSTVTNKGFRGYFNLVSCADVKSLSFNLDGEETSIEAIGMSTASDKLYDMQGRKVNAAQRGHIYIKDGRKFLAK